MTTTTGPHPGTNAEITDAAVFAAAAVATGWKRTNLGPRVEVSHASYTWTVELPASGHGQARITGRSGYGGNEFMDIEATWGQTAAIVDGAMAALAPSRTLSKEHPMNTTTPAVGQPVTITTGLPYSMTWNENDDLEDKEGVLLRIDASEFAREDAVPYQVQLTEGEEPVWVQTVAAIADPQHALRVATEATRHLAERAVRLAAEFQNYSITSAGRLAEIQEFANDADLPDAARDELNNLLTRD